MDKNHPDPQNRSASYTFSDQKTSDDSPSEIDPHEINGPRGLEPTRYGDWEKQGRCIDF